MMRDNSDAQLLHESSQTDRYANVPIMADGIAHDADILISVESCIAVFPDISGRFFTRRERLQLWPKSEITSFHRCLTGSLMPCFRSARSSSSFAKSFMVPGITVKRYQLRGR